MSVGIKVSLTLADSESDIAKEIVAALKDELNSYLLQAAKNATTRVRQLFKTHIESSLTWASLKNGTLKAEFGLGNDGPEKLDFILDVWINSIFIDYKPVTGSTSFRGGLSLQMVQTDWGDVLSTDAAIITTANGQVLPWLEWLLLNGDKTIIKDYEVVMKSSSRSRSGMALMTKKQSAKWRVPPEFSGTINKNFVTEALDAMENDIVTILNEELSK